MAGTLHRALLNRYALGTALTLVVAPFACIDRAMAACTPPSGQDNVTVTCASNTTNQDGSAGYGLGTENGVTVNVNSGVTVSGMDTGITLNNNATINNSGTVTGGTDGIVVFKNLTLNNSGSIVGTTDAGVVAQDGGVIINSGSITGATGINAGNSTSVNNTGTITANGGGTAVELNDSGTVNNAGTIISQGVNGKGIAGAGLTVTNSGQIQVDKTGIFDGASLNLVNTSGATIGASGVNGVGVSVIGSAAINNAGQITANDPTGIGLAVDQNLTLTNTGSASLISGGLSGIQTNTATISNQGGTIQVTGANGVAINGSNAAVNLANTGTIQANATGGIAVLGQTVNVTSNTGTISADTIAIKATDTATVNNAGTISTGVNGLGISAPTANVTNTGTITGGSNGRGLSTGIANVTNFGVISGGVAIQSSTANVTNAGQIIGGATGNGILASNANVTNSGMMSGKIAIVATDASTITNSGTIRSTDGATGTAIQISNASDTLNIKNGSSIIGLIDMGHGADVINVDSTTPSSKGVSMLSRATSAVVDALEQQLRNFDGVINIIGGGNAGGQPTVTANGRTASLDPTALAQQDRTLMDFTGGMSSMVQGRLGGAATGAGPMAMSYAMEDARAEMFSKAPAASWNAPVNVWTSAFGATRSQNGTDTTLDSTSSVYGGVIGVDRRIRPDWLIGAFAGGGSGRLNVDLGSQKLSTDYFSAGAYSRFEWDAQFIDMTLQAGGINNRSTRLVQNNITGGGETATASYNGWFVSPEVAYGYHIDLGNGTMVTPTARVRYVAGLFGGYTETGSAQTLTIGSRTLQDFEERGEVEVSKTGFLGDAALKGTLHGGVIALQRVGDSTVNAVLIGQSLSFITPGKSSAVGAVGGVGLDYHVTPNVALFGAVEGMMMSDQSRIGSAKGGVRVAF
jgi:uncharacterized protein with beta-barrel porin domain